MLELAADLSQLVLEWEKLGIDPDDFLRCGTCHRFFPDFEEMIGEPVPPGEEVCICGD